MSDVVKHMATVSAIKGWTNSGAWTYNPATEEIWLSKPVQPMFSSSEKTSLENFIRHVHPDDRLLLRKNISDLQHKTAFQVVVRVTGNEHTSYILINAETISESNLAVGIALNINTEFERIFKTAADFQAEHTATIETLVINNNTVQVLWSDSLFRQLGFERSDFTPTREHLFSLLHPLDVYIIHSEDSQNTQVRLKTRQDGYKWFLVTSKKVIEVESLISRMIYTFTDVDQLKTIEKELKEQNKNLESIINRSSEFLVIIDEKLDIIFYNEQIKRTFSPVRKRVPFVQWARFTENETSLKRRLDIAFIKDGKQTKSVLLKLFSNKKAHSILWQTRLIQYNNKAALLCQGTDVTSLYEQQLMLAGENNELKDFAHMASHNLRGPVANSLSLLDLYKNASTNEEREIYISKLEQVTEKLYSTITGFSEVLRQKGKATKDNIVLEEILTDTLQLFSESIQETNTVIHADFRNCPSVYYYKLIIESIFQNLISNSIKYRNTSTTPEITVTSSFINNRCIIIFKDNGSGFDMEHNGDKVFGLYNTFHKNPDSQGVGLYLVKKQLEDKGGSITLESTPGKGSTFCITL